MEYEVGILLDLAVASARSFADQNTVMEQTCSSCSPVETTASTTALTSLINEHLGRPFLVGRTLLIGRRTGKA